MKLEDGMQPTTEELDVLLCALHDASSIDPPAEIRDGLLRMAKASCEHSQRRSNWLLWAIPSSACAAVLLLSLGLHHFVTPRQRVSPIRSDQAPNEMAVADARRDGARPRTVRALSVAKKARHIHLLPFQEDPRSAGIDLELPYSDRAISNGTRTTIRVAISREELTALGIPTASGTGEGRYIADIALGDDGLPRSIHVPLPLRNIN